MESVLGVLVFLFGSGVLAVFFDRARLQVCISPTEHGFVNEGCPILLNVHNKGWGEVKNIRIDVHIAPPIEATSSLQLSPIPSLNPGQPPLQRLLVEYRHPPSQEGRGWMQLPAVYQSRNSFVIERPEANTFIKWQMYRFDIVVSAANMRRPAKKSIVLRICENGELQIEPLW